MVQISKTVIKKQKNFWNACVFHPTDAVEDPWGRRILDRMASDHAIQIVRIYSMFEDIVYLDENGTLCYDFRLSDLRLDYLIERGYDLFIAYAGIPDCIASSTKNKTTSAKSKTRYKGKMWNTSPPADYALWEDICYEYTKHNVERYGIETVARWRLHCFNEPDIPSFFLSELATEADDLQARLNAYCKLYEAFERGVTRVSELLCLGGPALAHEHVFLGGFLDFVRERGLRLDFISVHNYGTSIRRLNDGSRPFDVKDMVEKQTAYFETAAVHGFADTPLLVDEWGMSSSGFFNREECPSVIARESEVFSAYYVKLIWALIDSGLPMEMIAICLSGQHEMVEDFSGFRNFFTLNFIKKPIYNAHILASKLGENLLSYACDQENLFVIPTVDEQNHYAVLLTYCSKNFEEDIPSRSEMVCFDADISDKTVTLWCIDHVTTNPYRFYQRMKIGTPSIQDLQALREEGELKPVRIQKGSEPLSLKLTPNCTYLITVE